MARKDAIGNEILQRLDMYQERSCAMKQTDPVEYLHRTLYHGCLKLDVLNMGIRARVQGNRELAALLEEFDRTVAEMLSEVKETVDEITTEGSLLAGGPPHGDLS